MTSEENFSTETTIFQNSEIFPHVGIQKKKMVWDKRFYLFSFPINFIFILEFWKNADFIRYFYSKPIPIFQSGRCRRHNHT